jgi:hypothetical protein
MPRIFYDELNVDETLEFMYRECIRNNEFNNVPIEVLLTEVSKLEEKKDRLNRLHNEDLERVIEKIQVIENYLKNKK